MTDSQNRYAWPGLNRPHRVTNQLQSPIRPLYYKPIGPTDANPAWNLLMTRSSLCVALTGATGFVGRHVLAQLLAGGHRVHALVRHPHRLNTQDAKLHEVTGDLFDDDALGRLVDGANAVVHLVGIIMENPRCGQTFQRIHTQGTQRLLDAAKAAGVSRWVHMSALGSRPNAVSRYHRTKWDAEQAVRTSGLNHTIFRPSVIHGPDGEFMRMVKGFWCHVIPPFVPYFGKEHTAGRLQPVWVQDVARCYAEALSNPQADGETYPLGGPDVYTWPGFYRTCQAHLPTARKKRIVGLPLWYVKMIAGKPGVPFNLDQVVMSQEDSICQIAKVQEHFGFELAAFEPTFARYASQIE